MRTGREGSGKGTKTFALLAAMFGIDPRSLAVFRVGIGAIILCDLLIRAGDLGSMYSDWGMFPRYNICYHYTTIWNWSFHFGSGAVWYEGLLFSVAAVLAFCLMVGFGTEVGYHRFVVDVAVFASIEHVTGVERGGCAAANVAILGNFLTAWEGVVGRRVPQETEF